MIPGRQTSHRLLANMTPHREKEKNFHRGLSNQIYLFCMNSSNAWSGIIIDYGTNICFVVH